MLPPFSIVVFLFVGQLFVLPADLDVSVFVSITLTIDKNVMKIVKPYRLGIKTDNLMSITLI